MKMLKPIVDTINEIRNEYPIIGNELDGKIYYMNGNDGTDFDWNCNGRTCEFMVFHENEMGYITLMVYNDNFMTIYVYADGGMKPTDTITEYYDGNPIELASFLYKTFDEIRNLDYEKPYYFDDLNENNFFNMNWAISDLGDENWLRFKDI